MDKSELIKIYPGETVDAEDMKDVAAQKELEKAVAEGFTYVGTFDKDSTDEEIKALIRKSTEMHEKHFFGEDGLSLIGMASDKSIWRGYDYYKNGRVISFIETQIGD